MQILYCGTAKPTERDRMGAWYADHDVTGENQTRHDADQTVVEYARQALMMILDRHEIIVAPNRISVSSHTGDRYALYAWSLATGPKLLAVAIFKGKTRSGTLTLGWVDTEHWQCRFETIDEFEGYDHIGQPNWLSRATAARAPTTIQAA